MKKTIVFNLSPLDGKSGERVVEKIEEIIVRGKNE